MDGLEGLAGGRRDNQSNLTVASERDVALLTFGSVVMSLVVVVGAFVLLTYSLFKELRTLYTVLLMNYVSLVMLNALVFPGLVAASPIPALCQFFSIFVHYILLVRYFAIISLMIDVTGHFYHVLKLRPAQDSKKINKTTLLLHLSCSWGVPLLIVSVFVLVNYTVQGSILYGENGERCFVGGLAAIIVGVLAPIFMNVLISVFAAIFIVYVLIKVGCPNNVKGQSSRTTRNILLQDVRVVAAVLVLTGLSWTFGTVTILFTYRWSDYFSVSFELIQIVILAITYIFTKRVFNLYRDLLCGRARKFEVTGTRIDAHPKTRKVSQHQNFQSEQQH